NMAAFLLQKLSAHVRGAAQRLSIRMGGPNRADTPTVWVIRLLRNAANFGHFSDLPKFLIQDALCSSSAERIALPWAGKVLAASALVETWARLRDINTNSKSVVFFEVTVTVATSGSKAALLSFKM